MNLSKKWTGNIYIHDNSKNNINIIIWAYKMYVFNFLKLLAKWKYQFK